MNQVELGDRWRLSPRTLERWRWESVGPHYLKIRGRVLYQLSEVEEYEQSYVRKATPYDSSVRQCPIGYANPFKVNLEKEFPKLPHSRK